MPTNICPYCFQPINGYGPCLHCGHTAGEPRSGAQQLPLGTILDGKYRLGMVLGQGGFGITYLALDLKLQTRVAIKEYFPLGLVTRQAQMVTFSNPNAQPFFQKGVEAFYREAQLLARFQTHPNIVHVSSFFRQNGTAYFVMEYVEGESLSAYLERRGGRLPYDETVQLLSPVLDALSDVHSAGILHRDIAPDNICLANDGRIKLLDFGAAKNELSLHTHSSAAILKPGYAPLEQYSSGSNQGPWTDIYAMGAVIYRCLTDSVPPDAPDRIIGQPLLSFKEANVSVPAGAEAAINKALAPDIQNRWQHVADFKNALIDPSALKNIKPQTQKQEKSLKQKPRKPWLIPVVIIAALFLIAGVIISQAILPRERIYREGTLLIAAGKYEDAILKFGKIPSYRDSESQIRRSKSLQAEEYLVSDDYDNAMSLFTELSGEEYASERIAQKKEEYEQLHPPTPEPTFEIKPIVEIKPTEELLTPTQEPVPVQTELQKKLASVSKGDIITFGRYEQDGNEDNGAEDIEWIVLDKLDDQLFVVSRNGLDNMSMQRYSCNANASECQWRNTSIREWLNDEFLKESFNKDEKEIIKLSHLDTVENKKYGIKAEKFTLDRIFLLSIEEVEQYFPNKNDRIIVGTKKTENENMSNWWWLRSPGSNHVEAYDEIGFSGKIYHHQESNKGQNCTYVAYNGEIDDTGFDCKGRGIIRPAMYISLQSDHTNDNISDLDNEMISEQFSGDLQIGDTVQFGSYDQDGDETNGKEPIDWIILDIEEDKILLLSQYLVTRTMYHSYHSKYEKTTWESCDLRVWLNEKFLDLSFTDKQKEKILPTEVQTNDLILGGRLFLDGTTVTDRCFILSYEEIETYIEKENRAVPLFIDKDKVPTEWGKPTFLWWIRSGTDDKSEIPIVNINGNYQIHQIIYSDLGVRPAIWVKIEKQENIN